VPIKSVDIEVGNTVEGNIELVVEGSIALLALITATVKLTFCEMPLRRITSTLKIAFPPGLAV